MTSNVELRISCKNLPPIDKSSAITSLSAVVDFVIGKASSEFERTEKLDYNSNLEFSTTIDLMHLSNFNRYSLIRIKLVTSAEDSETEKFFAQATTSVGKIIGSNPLSLPLETEEGDVIPQAQIHLVAEEVKGRTDIATICFKAKKLDDKDYFSKSDSFFEVSKTNGDGPDKVIYRSEVIKNNLNPEWRPFNVRVSSLIGEENMPIKVSVFDYATIGSHDLIGSFSTNMEELAMATDSMVSWPCINEELKAKKKNYVNSGHVILSSIKFHRQYSFLDYLFQGLQISTGVGVDFTNKNHGDTSDEKSLHYLNENGDPNQYMEAISAVGGVLQDYNSKNAIPAFGFGATLPPSHNGVFHDFPLNFNPKSPYCEGIEGLLGAYKEFAQAVHFNGPSSPVPTINRVAQLALKTQDEEAENGANNYLVLLVLITDDVTDIDELCDALVATSDLPMSVVFIGVCSDSYVNLRKLTGNLADLRSTKGKPAVRDNVEVAEFSKQCGASASQLVEEVLAKIPTHIMEYFRLRNLAPKNQKEPLPPVPVS